jgi:hypothetical protein
MPIAILAQPTTTSSNAAGGAILTFAFPILLFAVIAAVLYYLLFRPHQRVPGRRIVLEASGSGAPHPAAAHGAAIAAGFPTASGGGSAESAAEPAGAKRDASADAADGSGNLSGGAGEPDQGTTDGTEGSE